MPLQISILLAILSETFIQIGFFSKSYTRKQERMFFPEHGVQRYENRAPRMLTWVGTVVDYMIDVRLAAARPESTCQT